MESISFNNKKYILSENIIENAPIYCKGIRNGRELIKKKNIDSKYFIYARIVDGEWVENDGKSVKYDKVFVRKSYIDKIIILMNELENKDITDENGIENAPEIIVLKDSEKFQDNDGNVLEIETRGKREFDKIFFKVKDVSEGFGIKKLQDIIIMNHTSYASEKDYKYFNCKNPNNVGIVTSKNNKISKELFLTYEGILRVLFVSKSGNAGKFIKWATEKLFTLQMGTEKQKKKMVADVLGVDLDTVVEVFDKNANTLPVVYFCTLGTVKELRKSMNIGNDHHDNEIVAIYGFTKDIVRRLGEHTKFYKKTENCDIKMKYYSYIDPQYLSTAESDIRACFNSFKSHYEYKSEKEMVIITSEQMNCVQMYYDNISKRYMGHISELITKLKESDNKYLTDIKDLTHNLELQKEKYEMILLKKEMMIKDEQYKNELSKEKYDNLILRHELELLKSKK